MKWFLAKIVYRIVCGEGHHTPQFDEQLRLIQAENEQEGFEKAKLLGESEADNFLNHDQKLVEWRFINISEFYRLSSLMDGAELYSRVQEVEDAVLYESTVTRRAQYIEQNISHSIIQAY